MGSFPVHPQVGSRPHWQHRPTVQRSSPQPQDSSCSIMSCQSIASWVKNNHEAQLCDLHTIYMYIYIYTYIHMQIHIHIYVLYHKYCCNMTDERQFSMIFHQSIKIFTQPPSRRHLLWISSECCDVLLHPVQSHTLILDRNIYGKTGQNHGFR